MPQLPYGDAYIFNTPKTDRAVALLYQEQRQRQAQQEADNKNLEQDVFHENDLEHYKEYNETFNPEAHSSLIIDFDKIETIEESAKNYDYSVQNTDHYPSETESFIIGAKSDAARNYWYQKFNEEQKGQNKEQKS